MAIDYVSRLQQETGCTIAFELNPATWPSGHKATPNAKIEPGICTVYIDSANYQDQEFEEATVHEITHGFLELKEGFYKASPITSYESRIEFGQRIMTTIQDPVVEKRLQDCGFNAIDQWFVDEVAKWTEELKKGNRLENCQKKHSWALTYVCVLLDKLIVSNAKRQVFEEFAAEFKKREEAIYKIDHLDRLDTIMAYDIFEPEGNLKAAKELFNKWKLDKDFVFKKIEKDHYILAR